MPGLAVTEDAARGHVPRKYVPRTRMQTAVRVGLELAALAGVGGLLYLLAPAWVPAAFGLLLVWGIVDIARWVFRDFRFRARFERARTQMLAGNVDEAVTIFDELCGEAKWDPAWHAALVACLGAAHVMRGDFERAKRLLLVALESRRLREADGFADVSYSAAVMMSMVHALEGEIDPAREWLERARKDKAGHATRPLAIREALIHCRSGEYRRALTILDGEWPQIATRVSARERLLASTLALYCLEHLGPDSYRQALVSLAPERMREDVRTSPPKLYAYLGTRWPDMHAFLAQFAAHP